MGFPSLASEFPHDNAEISSGTTWICPSLTGAAVAQHAPFEPVHSEPFVLWFDDESYVDGPLELELTPGSGDLVVHINLSASRPVLADGETVADASLKGETREGETTEVDALEVEATAPSQPEPQYPAFAHFESALVTALLAQGASRSAALLPRMLRLEQLPADALAKDVQLTLQSRGYLEGSSRYSAKFRELCSAWCAVLRGETQDFAACGTTTLDRFGAELLAALLAVPATRTDELRRELRKARIAAFGVLAAA